jgi:hypothetical protein
MNMGEMKLIEQAIYKSSLESDHYNYFRYNELKKRLLELNDKITMAEYMDVKLYLGHSMD